MSVLKGLPWLAAALLASVAGMAAAASRLRPDLAGAAAAAFAAGIVWFALRANRPLWRLPAERITAEAAPLAGVRNAALIALAYGWGAAALAALYTVSGLVWQHGLQYAAGMAVISLGIAVYARRLARSDSVLRSPAALRSVLTLTILHAAAAAGGVGALFLSGKLKSPKGDWGANVVFLIGGVTVFALSVIAATMQWRLGRRG
jgi:hypothetical protein